MTALYEISLQQGQGQRLDKLRYAEPDTMSIKTDELALLRLRYKQPDASASTLLEKVIATRAITRLDKTSDDFRFAAAVAAFGQQLRGGEYLEQFNYDDILQLARGARGDDHFGYRGEFVQLVSLAKSLH